MILDVGCGSPWRNPTMVARNIKLKMASGSIQPLEVIIIKQLFEVHGIEYSFSFLITCLTNQVVYDFLQG